MANTTPIGLVLCTVGLAVFLLAFSTRAVYKAEYEELDVGLTSAELCVDGECETYHLSYTDFYSETEEANESKVFSFLAVGARFTGLAMLVIVLVWAITTAARRRRTGAAVVLAVVSVAELLLLVGLVLMLPVEVGLITSTATLTGPGVGAYALMLGSAMLAAGAWLLRPRPPPRDADLPPEHRL